LFAGQDFYRDVISQCRSTPGRFGFYKVAAGSNMLAAVYQQRIWELEQEVRFDGVSNRTTKRAGAERSNYSRPSAIVFKVEENEAILTSRSWRIMQKFQRIRLKLMPIGSRQENWVFAFVNWLRIWKREGMRSFLSRIYDSFSWKIKLAILRYRFGRQGSSQIVNIEPVPPHPTYEPITGRIDIVVCVHNALEDVERCLESIVQHTTQPYSMILIDDGSDSPTQQLLTRFASQNSATLIRNEPASGYTRAANQGLRAARGDFVVLLNSDTIVTSGWLERLLTCVEADPKIGIVGPLSNTASWQSIPKIESSGDWATNPLPQGITTEKMAELVDQYSGYLFPSLPFLNGFCLLIRREVMNQIGFFNEELFGEGYGEENDYCLEARKEDETFPGRSGIGVYHAQSRSYSPERRKQLAGARRYHPGKEV
jgi:GT2 family glycosyltransferase